MGNSTCAHTCCVVDRRSFSLVLGKPKKKGMQSKIQLPRTANPQWLPRVSVGLNAIGSFFCAPKTRASVPLCVGVSTAVLSSCLVEANEKKKGTCDADSFVVRERHNHVCHRWTRKNLLAAVRATGSF